MGMIQVENLTRKFGHFTAVGGVSLETSARLVILTAVFSTAERTSGI